ncbi:MAG: helix-turn-helix transcriptional regulator [Pseudomonadota bacterium]
MTDSFGATFGRLIKSRRAKRFTQGQLAALVWPGDPQAEDTRKGDISKIENGRVANPHPTTVAKIADAIGISEAEIDELRKQAHLTTTAKLTDIPTLSLDALQILASKFGIGDPYEQSADTLREQLTLKAEEHRALIKQIDALKGLSTRIDNIHAAALHAAQAEDYAEANTLLENAREIHTEEFLRPAAETNAKLAETQADIALLRGGVDLAFILLNTAADSFAAVDPREPARRKILTYFARLYEHGLRYGGAGLPKSRALLGTVLTLNLKSKDAPLWAAGQNARAVALRNQGTRTEGAAGTDLLAQAVTAYRDALTVYTRADHPVDWAMTQNNLGGALQNQGTRTEGAAGADLLAQAVTAYRDALTVYTRADHPVQWAGMQNNLANVLQNQGIRSEGADLLAQAVTAYRNALAVRTRADHPVDWAMTQNNLANALASQGTRTEAAAGANLLAEAVTAYRDALTVRTRADHPLQWAMTQENIALTQMGIAAHDTCADSRAAHARALEAVDAALTVYDPVYMSYNHGTATRLRDDILAQLDALG